MKNFKIIHDRKNIPLDESNQLADFDSLMNKYLQSSKKNATFWKRIIWTIIALTAIGLISFLVYQSFTKRSEIRSNNNANIEAQSDKVEASEKEPVAEVRSDHQLTEELSVVNFDKEIKEPQPQNSSKQKIQEEKTMEFDYTDARPIVGFPALYQYFDENLVYPESLVKEQIQGKVVLKFVIDTLGRPADISVEIPLHRKLDSLAVEIIDNMPTWFPAERNGKPVPSTHRIPLNYQIEKKLEK